MLVLIWRLCRLLLVMLVLAVGLYLGSPYLLSAAGRYLITQQPLAKADLILVLSGQIYLRVPEGARLYHEGYAPKILLTNEPKEPGAENLLRVGIRVPDPQEAATNLLLKLRVPRDAILTIQERAVSTRTEMLTVARFLKSHPVRTLIIVTSKGHSTRAFKIFENGLGQGVRLIMHPVTNDPFDPGRWWQDRTDAKAVLHEYQALADFWLLWLWERIVGQVAAQSQAVAVR